MRAAKKNLKMSEESKSQIERVRQMARSWISDLDKEEPLHAIGQVITIVCDDHDRLTDELKAERARVTARDAELQNLKEATRHVAGFLPRHHHLCGIVCEASLLFEGEARQCDCGTDRLYAALGEEQMSDEVTSDEEEEN